MRDFYSFRVNHAQFYVNGNTVTSMIKSSLKCTLIYEVWRNKQTTFSGQGLIIKMLTISVADC